MRSINKTSRVPFVVSLTLIFGYGLLQMAVPPTIFGTQDQGIDQPLVTTPGIQAPLELVAHPGRPDTPGLEPGQPPQQ